MIFALFVLKKHFMHLDISLDDEVVTENLSCLRKY